MEGGGVKGLGIVGAISVLEEEGYRIRRIAGSSAGAIVGAPVAANISSTELRQLMTTLDYRRFRDEGWVDRFGWPGKAISLLAEKGIYEGKFLRNWLADRLKEHGVRTFGDLRLDDEPWAKDLPPEQRYRLVVTVSDITRGRLARLPWDYREYGLDPDTQSVADAVRASMSLPFFYEPVKLGRSLLVDGGMLSNFPIDTFESTPDWPTFGIKLSARSDANSRLTPRVGPFEFTEALISTALNAHDQMHLENPCTVRRTMFVDAASIQTTNFEITPAEQEMLFQSGRLAARRFFNGWDFSEYQAACPHLPAHNSPA